MGKNNETTTKFKVDISELVSGMQKAKRQIALANAEFKAGTAGMDNWASSADGVSKKINQLTKTLDAQEDILKNLENQYELTAKQMGADSKEAENLKIKIENQKASIAKTQKEIKSYNKQLDALENGTEDAGEAIEDMAKKAESAGDGFTVLKGAVAGFIGNLASSAIGGIKDMATSVLELSESTREYRDTMNKLNSAGESAGYGADYAKKKYKELYGVLGDETATSTTVSNFMAMNAEQSTLDSLLNSSIGIWAKYGDSIPLDGLAESVNETAKVGKITGNLADALNWAGINEDAFNEKLEKCTSEQERQRLIADTLNKTYGDLAGSYKETNASVIEANTANSDYMDKLAEMGAKVEPITTKMREGFTKVLEKILELTEDVDMSKVTEAMDKAFTVLINDVLPAVKDGLGWIIDNKDILIAGITGIAVAMATMNVANMIMNVVKAYKAFKLAQEGATVAQWLLNVAMSANPAGLIIALIMGLVTAFVVLWNKSDAFREFWLNLWDNLKNAVSVVVDWISKAFSKIMDFFKENWKAILLFIVNPFAGAFKLLYDNCEGFRKFIDNLVAKIKSYFSSLWTNLRDGAKNAWKFVSGIFVGVATWYKKTVIDPTIKFWVNLWSKLKNGAKDAWNGIKSVFSKVGQFFSDTFSKAWTNVKNIFSTGSKIFSGIKDGIANTFKEIVNKLISGINTIVKIPFNAINKMLNKLRSVQVAGFSPFSFIKENLVNAPEIPFLAKGTVVDSPTLAMIGEAGKEAVVPLENNTGWLDEVAGRIVSRGGIAGAGSRTVTNNYNYEFNQTNNSPKSLSRLEIYRQTKNQLAFAKGV